MTAPSEVSLAFMSAESLWPVSSTTKSGLPKVSGDSRLARSKMRRTRLETRGLRVTEVAEKRPFNWSRRRLGGEVSNFTDTSVRQHAGQSGGLNRFVPRCNVLAKAQRTFR